jgi:two-component sensor histidine kinase
MPQPTRVLIASDRPRPRLREAFERAGHRVEGAPLVHAVDAVDDGVEAVVIAAPREQAMAVARRLKTRYQVPLLPVVALAARARRASEEAAPDAWLSPNASPRAVIERVRELVRIRRAERELVRLNAALAELAAENGRLYDRARRDAEATTLLLRELQHRVRNNLAAIQALLVLERHRVPPRPLSEALDVALARLRSMAALQDSLTPHANAVNLGVLASAVAQGAVEVFGAADRLQVEITGGATLPPRTANAVAIVLNELITNALKHARASRVHVEIRDCPDHLELEVSDDGCGISQEAKGGSGLMIARAVVKNELAGALELVPAERGTRARLTIPKRW